MARINLKTQLDSLPDTPNPFALFVSLYLVIIAFFVLLNALSVKDELKEYDAVNSINKTFTDSIGIITINQGVLEDTSFVEIVKNYFSDVKSIMKSSFQIEEIDVEQSGSILYASVPIYTLFRPDSDNFRRDKKRFFSNIADILKKQRDGVEVRFEYSVSSGSFLKKKEYQLDISRASAVAEELNKMGVDRAYITGGISASDDGKIKMMFILTDKSGADKNE